jgi:macrolide transport system ATP-binding/permease protein
VKPRFLCGLFTFLRGEENGAENIELKRNLIQNSQEEYEVTYMTMLLNCKDISKDYGDKTVLKNISFDIAEGERIGLVGLNGAGKSTLVNIICGILNNDEGRLLWYKKNVNIGYLKQEEGYSESLSLEEGSEGFLNISSRLGLSKLYNWDIERLKNLSGGEKTKLALAKIYSKNPDFLILDEPTNHMDYKGVEWLIRELKNFKGTVLIISHDRYFLDNTVNRILEIEAGIMNSYNGNYSFYRAEKRRRHEAQLQAYEIQEEAKRKISEQIETLKNWSAKAHRDAPAKAAAAGNKKGGKEFLRTKAKKMDIQIKSRIKRLEKIKIEGVEKPKEERKTYFSLQMEKGSACRVIEASSITKGYKGKQLFKNSSFYIGRGEKIGLFGDNGCGKTTLLKVLLGSEVLQDGNIFVSSSLKIGYLSQDTGEIDGGKSVLELFEFNSREEKGRIQTMLYNMGFEEAMLLQKVSTLSLGEVTRLKLSKLIIEQCNLLILDEPSNHLDIHGREQLEEVLEAYEGTVILVSHDRYMLERLCSKLLVFKGGIIKRLEYGLKEYLARQESSLKKEEVNRNLEEERLLLDNKIALVLGELCSCKKDTEEYKELDQKYIELTARKRLISVK